MKKKKKHKKKSKRKHDIDSNKSSESDEPKTKVLKADDTCNNIRKKNHNKDNGLEKKNIHKSQNYEKLLTKSNLEVESTFSKEPDSPQLPPISRKVQDECEEQLIPKILGLYCTSESYFKKTIAA